MEHPGRMILIGSVLLVVGGIILPFLMTIRIINVTAINEVLAWILIFGSYSMSVVGLFLGVIGFTMYARKRRPPEK